jgi:hypothetical protein
MQLALEASIAALAVHQHGVVTHAQLKALGASNQQIRRRVEAGSLERVFDLVYRSRATPRTWHGDLLAACWAGGPRAVASHRSAVRLWGLTDDRDDDLEITTPRWRRSRSPGLVVHEIKRLDPRDVATVDGIPVTGPDLSLVHYGASRGPFALEKAYERATHAGLVTWDSCDELLRRYARSGRPGVTLLRAVLAKKDPEAAPTESDMETEVLQLCERFGLPTPVTQFLLYDECDQLVGRLDAAWPDARVGVEYQSLRYHSLESKKAADRVRIHNAEEIAWRVIQLGPDDVRAGRSRAARVLRVALEQGRALAVLASQEVA